MTQQDDEEYLTAEEASRHLGVTRRTLERYVEQGRIKKYRRGVRNMVFFKRAELDALLEIRPDEQSPR